jgi:hypothetical protein
VKNKDAGELVTAGQVKLIRRLLSKCEKEARNKNLCEELRRKQGLLE